jgi:hypothetical protein
MSVATCLVTLNTKPHNLFFMLKALNVHQDIIAYVVDRPIAKM